MGRDLRCVAVFGAAYGMSSPDWMNVRNGYRHGDFDTRVGALDMAIPKLSTSRIEKLVESLGITRLSRSQVSVVAAVLDAAVEDFRTRRLDAGPYTFAAADAVVLKVREGGRVVNVHALLATGVNGDGPREILGLQVTSAEDGAGWLAIFRDLTARGSSAMLMTSRAGQDRGAAVPGGPFVGKQTSERGIGEPTAEQPECLGAGLAALARWRGGAPPAGA